MALHPMFIMAAAIRNVNNYTLVNCIRKQTTKSDKTIIYSTSKRIRKQLYSFVFADF